MSLDDATKNFFAELKGVDKTAVELTPATKDLLDAEDIPPAVLDEVERAAKPAAADQHPQPAAVARVLGEADHRAPPPAAAPVVQGGEGVPSSQVHPNPNHNLDEAAPASLAPEHEEPLPEQHIIDASGRAPETDQSPPPDEEELPVPEEGEPGRTTHGKIFNSRRTHPMRLRDVLMARYQEEWITWEPETLWWAIRRDFGPVGEVTRNKIQALRTAIVSYQPWTHWDIFENCGVAWNDNIPIFGAYQPMTPAQTAFAIQILQELHPEAPWDHEIAAYEAAVLDENGFVYAPEKWFPGAQLLLDRKDWTIGFKAEVARAWQALSSVDPTTIEWRENNPVDIHVAKLFVIQVYLEERAALRNGNPEDERLSVASTPTSPPVP